MTTGGEGTDCLICHKTIQPEAYTRQFYEKDAAGTMVPSGAWAHGSCWEADRWEKRSCARCGVPKRVKIMVLGWSLVDGAPVAKESRYTQEYCQPCQWIRRAEDHEHQARNFRHKAAAAMAKRAGRMKPG